MSGMSVTHAGGEAEVNTTSGIAYCSKATRSFVTGGLILRKKCRSWMNFPIFLHSRTGHKTASVTLSMMVHLWMDFSVFQGVAPLSQSFSNHKSSRCMQLLRSESKMCCCLTKW